MNLIRLIIELLVIYFIYKLVFELIIPVARTTRQMKKKMEEFQQRQQSAPEPPQQQATKSNPKGKDGDYIEYEEV